MTGFERSLPRRVILISVPYRLSQESGAGFLRVLGLTAVYFSVDLRKRANAEKS